jgi:hypothetical protein
MRKILFLDMDGVVLSLKALWATHNPRYLPPRKIALLNRIVEQSGCTVVMSSVWRSDPSVRPLMAKAGFLGKWDEPWKTPHDSGVPGEHTRRGLEIQAWFKLTKLDQFATRYAILDDSSDFLPHQFPHFVKTNSEEGLSIANAMNVVGILDRDIPPSETGRIPVFDMQ